MLEKGILPLTIEMILKSHYPLPSAEPGSLWDDQIEDNSLEILADGQEEASSVSPMP